MSVVDEEGIEEKERFWNDLDMIVDRVGNGYRLCVLGDLNGCVGDRLKVGTTGGFGIPGENANCRRVVEFCEERGLCVGNTFLSTEV